jgi:hypothetical protein
MTLVDFAQVRASLADKTLVGFENGMDRGLDKAATTKCGLVKNGSAKRGILKVTSAKRGITKTNGTKRGPKPSPVLA